MNLLGTALAASMAWTVAALAADCPRKGTLGTSRILGVDAAAAPRVGLKNFPQTLPLEDHEVVSANRHQNTPAWCEGSPPRATPSDITPGCTAA